ALAILMPRRNIETDRNASSDGGRNFPPPGFNASEAKKPLPGKDAQAQQSGAKEGKEAQGLKREAAEKAAADKNQDKKALEGKKEESKQLTMWQKIKKEAAHYWDGTKLLAAEVRISSKLALKMAAGYELTRRETRQLHRTVKDLSRLVPFSVFIIVPLGELLIPVVLKLFPNFLPSTFEDLKTRDAKTSKLRETRKEVSNFLRTTLKETGLPVSPASAQREEFAEFFRKVRTTGEEPTKADVIKVCKIFKDDLTLDNLSRPQLVAICRYMSLNTFGTDAMLRYNIRHRMRQIKRDDKAIFLEGVDSLSVTELQSACAARGLRTHGLSPARLREDLQMWLDLRLKYGVPSTLLVLSNAYVYAMGKESEFNSQIDALQAVLSSIPEELFHEIELEVHTAEGAATNKQRLEVLKEQQELIEEENQQRETSQSGRSTPNDTEDIDDKEEALAEAGKEAADPKAPEAREAKEAEKA
ncbi:LETM1-like protein-domain-containing protein, partial [Lineolata rhizophorae]